jgi:glycosyltransferase involved in cell wall biosynthesis
MVHRADGEHGVSRYGDSIAAFMSASPGLHVTRTPAGKGLWSFLAGITQCLRSDVVHAQWSPIYWGTGWSAVVRALILALMALRRPVVVTMHDVHHEAALPVTLAPDPTIAPTSSQASTLESSRPARRRDPRVIARAIVTRRATEVLVFTPEERLQVARKGARSVAVIPHFVPGYAPRRARPNDHHLVVFGFIHPRKGQLLAVEALPLLPGYVLTLCGMAEARHEGYLEEIWRRARTLGVADRLDVTGFVDDAAVDALLADTRVALCPYQRIAASGSIATLLSRGVPVVAHSTAYTRRLHATAPQGVSLFEPWSAIALAEGVRRSMAVDLDGQREELRRLAEAHGPDVTSDRHKDVYRRLLGRSAPRR